MTRRAIVAGKFYSANKETLEKDVSDFTAKKTTKIDAIGVVSPHAGYVYSGSVAGETLSSIKPKPTYIILGTNHTGYGKPFGLDMERNWQTPLGEAKVDEDLAHLILKDSEQIKKDHQCHDYEHSIEVQLPFLQHLNKDFTFVPITISHWDTGKYQEIGKELAQAVKTSGKDVAIIASSDMTHYEAQESAKKKDMTAIEKILQLDIDGFLKAVAQNQISMCGAPPVAVMMAASMELGAKKAKLIKYATSGEVSGDYSSVVGYAGIVVY